MGAVAVTCPKCEGGGVIRVLKLVGDASGRKHFVEADCPVCSGTGQASMLEKMAVRRGHAPHQDVT